MIVQIVEEVKTCFQCPNFDRVAKNLMKDYYRCKAINRIIGGSDGKASVKMLKKGITPLCPFAEDEVNQRPIRGR